MLPRALLPAFTAALVLFTATACGRKEPAPTGGPAPKILLFGNGAEPQDLDPQTVTGVPENKLLNAFFEGLVSYGPTANDTVGGVAERWDISADGTVYNFHLRAEAKWSNGDPVTAQDFARSYQRILTPSLGAEYAYKFAPVIGAEDYQRGTLTDFSQVGIKALDARTLEIRLKHPVPYLLEAMKHYAWFPVHIASVEQHGGLTSRGKAWTRVENFVGNGPFVLKSWRPNQVIVAERSSTYWDRAAVKLDAIHFFPTENLDTEERMFRTGQLHKTYELPAAKIDVYQRDFPDSYRSDVYYGSYYFRFNVTRKPLDDVRVRRALSLAIDRESLARNVVRGGQQPAYGMTPPTEKYTARARLTGDLTEARRLLAEAGFPEGRGFPRIELLYNTQDNHRRVCEALQEMWRQNLGIEVGLINQEWKVYLRSMDTLDYDMARGGWIGDYNDPNSFYDTFVTGGGNNRTGWSNARYDQLLRDTGRAPDETARMELYQQMEEIIVQELPIMPVYFYRKVYALSPLVHWPANPLDNQNWKFVHFKE
ncbi:Periplasmic oligopeptide-binding protein precursor [Lacunisphaera limnophila]|uniref:Periplasmic oligopeptide-binding protein n=1 Tax=Lacunisphaera limnophila TaxID=1838286 RepID=A0A1D8AVG4_9BACT|nr:peptide ABC transporter substrate-binding protein [Lacunisphaera limnophila]AOS44890.1 Periplasmic oligopeptide-binding protein precursor [Lacunisphaera limnophila]